MINFKTSKIYFIITIICVVILIIGGSLAWFTWDSNTNTDINFVINGLDITSTNTDVSGVLYPTGDMNNGIKKEFTIVQNNLNSINTCGELNMTIVTLPNELKHESFRYRVYNEDNLVASGNFADKLEGQVINIGSSQNITNNISNYKIYLWIDGENFDNPLNMGGKSFSFNLGIIANQSNLACNPSFVDEDLIDMNAPDLIDGMIPVRYDGTNWVVASSTNVLNNWYNYDADIKMWANAVMLREENRNVSINQVLDINNILAFFVWIPRYKYKLFNVGTALASYNTTTNVCTTNCPIEIELKFENGTNTTGILSDNPQNGEWYTHPAFTLGDKQLKGLWVGKFETSVDKTSLCYTSPNTTNCNNSNQSPRIIPSVYSLVEQTMLYKRDTVNKFASTFYLSNSGIEQADTHIMKNIEWGAVTYFTYSKYGLSTSDIGINNYSDSSNDYKQKTGCGSQAGTGAANVCNNYDTQTGQLASTTANIYGIYDMSGGYFETVMGFARNQTNTSLVYSSSGFNSTTLPINSIYVDTYPYGTTGNTYTKNEALVRRTLGDATGEINGWYRDKMQFVFDYLPVFARGGAYGQQYAAGIGNLNAVNGGSGYAFRSVISKNS